jgi:hypothetical protein
MRVVAVVLVALAACGDNGDFGDDTTDGPCEPPAATLPASGMYIDPYAPELPASCVEHGLRGLPGRWFVADQSTYFRFEYPKYEGSCNTGFRRSFTEDDHDLAEDGYTLHTWSDGTRYFEREAYQFNDTTFISTYAACMLPDGTLATTYTNYDNERGERSYAAPGKRFAPKDELASGLTLVGEIGNVDGRPLQGLNLVIVGQHAYLAGFTGMDVIDVSDPAAPKARGHYGGSWNDIRVVSNGTSTVAFLSPRGNDPTEVVNVTDPAAPVFLRNLTEYSHSLFVQERNATKELYLATYNESVPKYDVTNPLNPVFSGMAIVPGEVSGVHDLFVGGDRIYANNTTQGMVAFDVSGGLTNEVELGRFKVGYSHASWAGMLGGRQIVLTGDEGMTGTSAGGAHLSILDGDPQSATFMKELAKYQTRPEAGIHNFEVHGNKAYIAYYQDGVRIVDLSNPAQPREVAHYNTWVEENSYGGAFEGALGIRKVGDLVYVADLARGLMIFREQ